MLKAAPALSALLLAACASPAYSPGVLVLPGSKKTFDQFRFDEQECRAYAQAQLTDSGSEWGSAGSTQQRYDRAFLQCMYAKGHKVPVSGRYFDAEPQAAVPKPPPPPQAQPPTPPPPPAQPPTPPPSPQG
jgi:hypothetical protein